MPMMGGMTKHEGSPMLAGSFNVNVKFKQFFLFNTELFVFFFMPFKLFTTILY